MTPNVQRGFDDPHQIKIQLEALACENIFVRAEEKQITLVWSFMHEDENLLCPFLERKLEVSRLSALCAIRVGPIVDVYQLAKDFQQKAKLSANDAVHLACAFHGKCRFFLTCDNDFIKRAMRLNLEMKIMNPVDYVQEVAK